MTSYQPAQPPESVTELLELPEDQRQLMLWMMRQGTLPFADIQSHVGRSSENVRSLLANLIQQGLVNVVGDDAYRAYSPTRRQQPIAENLLQSLSPGNPIAVILSTSRRELITPGSRFDLGVTVSNRGPESAIINVMLDGLPPVLRQGCSRTLEYLALAPNQSGEVVFEFQIPADTIPGLLSFVLLVDAPQHYPESPPIRHEQVLQVLPPVQDTVQAADPTFTLEPISSSSQPLRLMPGSVLPMQVMIYNRSDRVDRFRLTCTDFPETWFTVTYPQDNEGFGLVVEADSLGLNPGDQGLIMLTLSPPAIALADIYVPTLRLYSENNPDLVLLDLVYIEVLPVYQLQADLKTLVNQVRRQPAWFQIELTNQGNTPRLIQMGVQNLDERGICEYTLGLEEVAIAPYDKAQIELKGQPKQRWKRPWFGVGRILNFRVDIADAANHPVPTTSFPGYITWMPRPWWQLLLALIALLGLIGALIWLIWWLFFKPPLKPEIIEFFPEESQYAAASQDVAEIGWQIENPDRIQTLKITGYDAEGKAISGPLTYDLSGKTLPAALAAACVEAQQVLTCRNVPTDARQPAEYTFELTVIPKGRFRAQPQSKTSSPVVITPVPLPTVAELVPDQVIYSEAGTVPTPDNPVPPVSNKGVTLSWIVDNPAKLQDLLLVVHKEDGSVLGGRRYLLRNPDDPSQLQLPEELAPYCQLQGALICQGVPTGIGEVGKFTFELTPQAIGNPEPAPEAKQTEIVEIQPRPVRIVSFQVNGQEAQPKYLIPVDQGQPIPGFVLSWKIEGGSTAKAELLPSPGSVGPEGSIPFPLSPEPGETTITLQVSDGFHDPILRSVTVTTFDPTPTDPAQAAAEAAAAAAAASQQDGGGSGGGGGGGTGTSEPGLQMPSAAEPGQLSPSEVPPQFD